LRFYQEKQTATIDTMKKNILPLFFILASCKEVKLSPTAEIYIMAGQSNMAGRADIMSIDTNTSESVIFLDENGKWQIAEEPLHRFEKNRGLDCGLSFAKERLKQLPAGSQIALIPCAVGGSSIRQWLFDSVHRNQKLYTNLINRSSSTKHISGVLWMQGESDANDSMYKYFGNQARLFFMKLRKDLKCPIYVAELPSFQPYADSINRYIQQISEIHIIKSAGLKHKGDTLHLDSESQRELGRRFAAAVK